MNVIVTNKANQDMKEIFAYISKDSLKYAIETNKNIRLIIHNLKLSPYLGRFVPELEDKQYRELLYKSYRIIYSISEVTNTIYIHSIVHSKRNLNLFNFKFNF